MCKIAFRDDPIRHRQVWPSIYTKLSCELEVAIRIPFVKEHSEINMGTLIREVATMEPCSEVGRKISHKFCQRFSDKGQYTPCLLYTSDAADE